MEQRKVGEITVFKLNDKGAVVWRYPARILERRKNLVRVEAFFNRDDLDLGFAMFKRGDRFIETFYNDRWYNVFAVYDGHEGSLQGWYCNICRPARLEDAAVYCEDLALDLWVTPSGGILLLDEDEFELLALDFSEYQSCLNALQELQEIAQAGLLPQ